MSSVGVRGNQFGSVRGRFESLIQSNAATLEQVKALALEFNGKAAALLKRVEDLESANQLLKTEVQALKVASASASASASAAAPAPSAATPPSTGTRA
jgi:predicted  nucleic acid-binding Zn-ribbon protein